MNNILKRVLGIGFACMLLLTMLLLSALAVHTQKALQNELASTFGTAGKNVGEFEGKTLSILGASMSTYTGISNNPDYNSTIGNNAVYYTAGKHGVYADDTWWMQVCSDMGLRLMVNNSWSGSSLLHERNGTVGAYVDRCVQLHNNAGEDPDIIAIQMGTNDFQYYKDTLGTADIDYSALITENGDGTYTYSTPVTSLEAAAIVLHKISVRYPNAEVYYLNISQRIDGTDDLIRSFNAELKQVVEHFGAHIVDIYGSAITMETFRTYIGDGRVHTNCLGMDAYTEAFKRSLIANTSYSVNTHTVSMQLDGVTADYGDDKIVVDGDAFEVNLSASAGDVLDVSVTMGGKDITLSAYANGKVTIAAVTDDVVITAASVHEPKDYRWEFDGSDLACVKGENTLTKNAGTTTDGVFANTRYALAYSVVLLHNEPWVVEWKCEGTFQNSGGSSGARIFTSTDVNAEYNARYIFKSNTNGLIAMGEKTSTGSHNYGIALGDHGIDWTALHTYRLENRIAADGSNMIWLYVDGEEIGPMTGYYIGTKAQNTTSDWLSGKDFTFPYMGTDTHGFTNAAISYICVAESTHTHAYIATVTAPTCTEGGYTTNTCTICGDSYVDGYTDAKGHSYENGMCTVCGSAAPMDTVTTTDALVAAIRQAMVQRQTSIQLRLEGIALTSSDVSAAITQACAHTGLPNEGDYIRANMLGYSWSLTTGSDANGAYSIISITCNFISDAQMEAEVDAAVDQLLSELNLWDASNYEKVKGVYDWITENISYDYEWDDIEDDTAYYKHTTHAALIQKNAVCQGFASLYYRLMLELGVDCRYISGISTDITGTENHAWNIVYLDGKYFNCDPTWDRSLAGHYRYFLCTEANFSGHTRDAEYDTAQFHADYPMAVTPYVQNVTASGTVNSSIEWVLDGDTGTLTVAGTGAIPSYRYSDAPWYAYRESVKKIVVSEGITEVGERAFYWCVNCTEVDLPDSLVAIREYGFNNLRNLKNITLPSNLKTIEFCAFSECVALVSITLPDSVTTVGSNAFSNCTALTSAVLSNGMTSIPSSMFGNDSKLKKVVLPEGITYIDDTAFINCGFTEITLPASVTKLGTSVFSGCTYLSRFIVEEGNTAFKAVDGVLFSADGTHLICYPAAKFGDYTVPEGTVYIDYGAFRSQKYMNYVYFPSTLTKIDGYAFSYCYNLIRVTFNSNITTIGSDAFRSCTGLVSVTFENPNVTLVGYTFAGCTALRTIKLPSNLSQIPNGLFYGCTNLQSISIPSTVTKIGSSAFLDCDSLVSVTVPGTVESIGQQAFDFCNKLETVVFEEGVTTLGWICIRNAPKLKKVVIPSTVTKIEQPSNTTSYLFDDCPNVVVYVICGSYGHSYAISRGLAYQASHTVTPTIVLPTCTEEGYTHYTCPCGANDYYTDYTPALGHDYHGVTTSPTCTEAGYTTYTCTRCADSFIDDYVAASHSFEAWDILTEATCTTDGEKRRDCVVCDYYEMITIPATGHSYASAVTEPTCTEKGYTTHTCTTCGDSYKDSYLDAKGHTPGAQATCTTAQICAVCNLELVAAFGHDEVYHEAKIPTCTEIGWDAYVTCSRCDYSTYAEKAALGHDEVHHEAKAPTCTEIGWDAYVSCSRCDYGTYVEKAALGHDEVHHEAKTPTCTEIGWDAYVTCSRCDYSTYAGKAALGHDEVHHAAKAPTCTEIGWDAYVTCSRCDYSTYAEKAALGHDEVHHAAKAPTCTEIGWDAYVTCSRCDYSTYTEKAALGHDEVEHAAKAPTCTEIGWDAYVTCSRCDYSTYTEKAVLGHDEVEHAAKAPTCTEIGWDAYVTCSRCDYSTYVEKSALGHDEVSHEAKMPTCTEIGWDAYVTCSRCDYSTYAGKAALGHDEVHHAAKAPTCTEIGWDAYVTCSRCDYSTYAEKAALGHDEVHHAAKAPTCTEIGWDAYVTCSRCDYSTYAEKAALGHDEVHHETKTPTCTEIGWDAYVTCSRCDYSTYVEKAALGHDEVSHEAKMPTCTEIGWDAYVTCSRCDYSTYTEKAALGHDEVAHEAKAPTCTEIGWDAYVTCSRCDYSTYAEKAAMGHDEVAHEAKIPTCTEIGWDAYVTCSRCDYSTYAEKAALGHDEVHHEAKTPTCTEIGWDAYVTCSRCDYSTYAGKAALGHDEVHHEAKTPTCTEIGWDAYVTCSRCDYSTYAEKVALGHDEVHHEAKAPTCTEIGWDAYVTCSRCDYSTYAEKAAFGHTEVVDVAVAPTCTATGLTEGKHCSVCGEVLVAQQVIAAIDHDYSAVVTEPTCTDKGYTTHICTNCGASYTSDHTDALGHSYDIAVTEPTCMEPGSITYTCHCGDTYTEVVPATGHESTHLENAKDATCGADGYTGDWICNQCGATVENGMVISATGSHQYGDWVVITEPTTKDSGLREHTCVNCGHTEQEIMDPIAALMGDVNGDGRINARDARVLLRYLAGLAEESGLDLVAADYNGDGHVNARDARTILRYIAGMN